MFTLDASIVNIAVPTLVRELHASLTEIQWVIQAYLAVMVGCILPLAHFSSRIGPRRLFLSGILIFTAGSLLCGTADTVEHLVVFRVIQAMGAAGIAALMSAIIHATFPAGQLARALGLVTATATLGTSLGPTIGGFLIHAGSWHSIFLVNVPVGIAAFFLVRFSLPRSADVGRSEPGGAAWENYLELFQVATLRDGLLGRMATMMANGAFLFLTPLILEFALGYPTVKAGLFLAASPILVGVLSPLFGWIADRMGRTPVILGGLGCMVAGMLVMHTFSASMSETGFLLRVILWAIGMGMFNAPNAASVMAVAPKRLSEAVSALLSLSIMLGQLFGVTLGGTFFHHFAQANPAAEVPVKSLPPEVLAGAVADVLPWFALPLAIILLSTIWRVRRDSPARKGQVARA